MRQQRKANEASGCLGEVAEATLLQAGGCRIERRPTRCVHGIGQRSGRDGKIERRQLREHNQDRNDAKECPIGVQYQAHAELECESLS